MKAPTPEDAPLASVAVAVRHATRLDALRDFWARHGLPDRWSCETFMRNEPAAANALLIADEETKLSLGCTIAAEIARFDANALLAVLLPLPPLALSRSAAFVALRGRERWFDPWRVVTCTIDSTTKNKFKCITELQWAAIEAQPTESPACIEAERDAHLVSLGDPKDIPNIDIVRAWFAARISCAVLPSAETTALSTAKRFIFINILTTTASLEMLKWRHVHTGVANMSLANKIFHVLFGEHTTVALLIGDSGSGKTQAAVLSPIASQSVLLHSPPPTAAECLTVYVTATDLHQINAAENGLSQSWAGLEEQQKTERAEETVKHLCEGVSADLGLSEIRQECTATTVIVFDEMGGHPHVVRALLRARVSVLERMRKSLKLTSESRLGMIIVGTGLGGSTPAGSHPTTYTVINAVESCSAVSLAHYTERISALGDAYGAWSNLLNPRPGEGSGAVTIARGILENWRAGALFLNFVSGPTIHPRCLDFATAWLPAVNLQSSAQYRCLNGMNTLKTVDDYLVVMAMALCASQYPLSVMTASQSPNVALIAKSRLDLFVSYGVLVDQASQQEDVTATNLSKYAQCVHEGFDGVKYNTTYVLAPHIDERRRFAVSHAARAMWIAHVCQTCSRGATPDEFELACADAVVLQLHMALVAHREIMHFYGPPPVAHRSHPCAGRIDVANLLKHVKLRVASTNVPHSSHWIPTHDLLLVLCTVLSSYTKNPSELAPELPRVQYFRLPEKLEPNNADVNILCGVHKAVLRGCIVVAKNEDSASAEDVSVVLLRDGVVLHIGIQSKQYTRTPLTNAMLNAERKKLTDATVLKCFDEAFAPFPVLHLPVLMVYSTLTLLRIALDEPLLCVRARAEGANRRNDAVTAAGPLMPELWPVTFSHNSMNALRSSDEDEMGPAKAKRNRNW